MIKVHHGWWWCYDDGDGCKDNGGDDSGGDDSGGDDSGDIDEDDILNGKNQNKLHHKCQQC